jgi:HSP20 family molecular chaperone IbpA
MAHKDRYDSQDPLREMLDRLVEAIEEAEREGHPTRRTGSVLGNPFQAEYGFTVGLGPGTIDANHVPDNTSALVDIRETPDGIQIVGDLPNVDGESVTFDVEDDRLAIRSRDDVLAEIPMPAEIELLGSSFNNGIAVVDLRRCETGGQND